MTSISWDDQYWSQSRDADFQSDHSSLEDVREATYELSKRNLSPKTGHIPRLVALETRLGKPILEVLGDLDGEGMTWH